MLKLHKFNIKVIVLTLLVGVFISYLLHIPFKEVVSPINSIASANTVSYSNTLEDFPNPDRGITFQNDVPWPPGGATWDFCATGNNFTAYNYTAWNDPLDPVFLQGQRALGRANIMTRYHIADFRNRPLTQAYLDFLQNDFNTLRNAGMRESIRFAYNYPNGGPDAPLSVIRGHIAQLKPILSANTDVISFAEAGFIGCFGEWHHSSNGLTNNETPDDGHINPGQTQVINDMLDALPTTRQLVVRYPFYKAEYLGGVGAKMPSAILPSEAFNGSPKSRLGNEDDCPVCTTNHYGTFFSLQDTEAEVKAYNIENSKYVVQEGEPGDPDSGPPTFIANSTGYLASCEYARLFHREQRYSIQGLFNIGSPTSVFTRWKNDGCYDEISRSLGYRFRMISTQVPTTIEKNTNLNLNIKMKNDGYASPYNPRDLEVILRNKSNGVVYPYKVTTQNDPRFWLPDLGEFDVNLNFSVTAPVGEYDVLVNMPDPLPSIKARPEYSIRLANLNTWEPTTGYNKLNQTVSVLAAPTVSSSSSSSSSSSTNSTPATLSLKANLSGNFNDSTDLMETSLKNKGVIPLTQPFNSNVYNYSGSETLTSNTLIGNNVVDWALVEIKNGSGAIVLRKAGFILADGKIVNHSSNATSLSLDNLPTGTYKVVVHSRNHLGIATDINVTIATNSNTVLDFSKNINVKSNNQIIVGTDTGGNNIYGMRKGDSNNDGIVDAGDRASIRTAPEADGVYVKNDINGDGIVDATDRALIRNTPEAVEVL